MKKAVSFFIAAFTLAVALLISFPACAEDTYSALGERIYISHFSGYVGSSSVDVGLYGESFFLMPDDEYIDETLALLRKAFALVIEKDGDTYTVVHTAQYEDKSDWKSKWLKSDNGNKRFIFAAYLMNDHTKYIDTYNFEMQSFKAVANGFDPSDAMHGDGEEGAFFGQNVYFYNVDFENRALSTEEEWETPLFKSNSYFTVGEPDATPIAAAPTVTVDEKNSISYKLKLKEDMNKPANTSSSGSSRSSKLFGIAVIFLTAAAVIIISVQLYKKQSAKKSNKHSSSSGKSSKHHHSHHSSHSSSDEHGHKAENSDKLFGEDVVKHSHHHHHHTSSSSQSDDNKPENDSSVTHED